MTFMLNRVSRLFLAVLMLVTIGVLSGCICPHAKKSAKHCKTTCCCPNHGNFDGKVEPVELTMLPVAGGWFEMGARDDEFTIFSDERPKHMVKLDSYTISKYEVTVQQYADMLNWALVKKYLTGQDGKPYSGGNVFVNGKIAVKMEISYCPLEFKNGKFSSRIVHGQPVARHPMVEVSWFGAAAYCNWLNEKEGLPMAYDANWNNLWSPTVELVKRGYHLPTSAQFEKATGWNTSGTRTTLPDGTKGSHWIYHYQSDTLDQSRINNAPDWNPANPQKMITAPFTTEVGFFDGKHGYPDSPGPCDTYDMGGNAWEWCNDWNYSYTTNSEVNPMGPETGTQRVFRGGCFEDFNLMTRTAHKGYQDPKICGYIFGFRLAR